MRCHHILVRLYETKTISEKNFLNNYAIKNDVDDVKGTASDFCLSGTGPNNICIDSEAADETHTEAKKAKPDAIRRILKKVYLNK